ncbi:methyltransferase-like protein 5 isoform X1 [Tanacetum coccineum]
MEYLVNISKRRALWSLNEDILKITVLRTYLRIAVITLYPSRKIRRIYACTHQRPRRKHDQYAVSREDQYAASKKQTCITGSTIKSEFVALATASKEAKWLKNLLLEIPLWSKPIAHILIRCDSVATLAKAYSQMYNGKSRHLGVRHSMIRELITNGVISIEFVRSQQNLVDHLTKGLARDLVIKSAEGMLLPSWIDTSYSVRFLMTIDMSLFGASLLAVTFTLANPNSRSRPMALIKELSRPHMCQQNSFEDISGKVVADFGCGCGTLGLAATLLDADFVFDSHVIGVDRDEDSLEIASINADDLEVEMELIQCQINNLKWRGQIVDTVVMNPPFGTRNKGVDMEFLSVVLKVASQAVYSLHKTTTREHIKRAALRDYNAASAELRYDLPKLYKFHKKKVVDIVVDLCRFVPKT